MHQAFILCAGAGTRMLPLTLARPKCLLELAGKPILRHILDWLVRHDFDRAIVNTCYLAEQVQAFVAAYPGPLHLSCSVETEPLGTAGGIAQCYDQLDKEFAIIYGDIVTNADLRCYAQMARLPLTIVSQERADPQSCGILQRDPQGRVQAIIEKPTHFVGREANAGIMLCEKKLFRLVTKGSDLCIDLVPLLLYLGIPVYAEPLKSGEWLFDVGTRENFAQASDLLSRAGAG